LKCLSVSQPFADLIVSGKKRIELRSWNTRFRGEFLVHAPLKIRAEDAKRLRMNREFVTGAVVGKAEIFDVKKYRTKTEMRQDYRSHLASRKFQDKKYGFMLKNAKMLRVPIPCRGQLGFFEADLPGKKFSEDFIKADIIDEEYRYQWVNRH